MSYSRKNTNRGIEDMEFSGILKKEHVEIPGGQLKKKWDFPGYSRKSHGILMGLGFWPWNFQGESHNFAEFPGVKTCFLWNF